MHNNLYNVYNKNSISNYAVINKTKTGCTAVIDISDLYNIPIPTSVCSTINPYSYQNIIGSLNEYHDMLNKMYPYDRQNNFQLWFNDKNGKRVVNDCATGYIDLELIIDNTNNINLDV